jgi:hypothetical protein
MFAVLRELRSNEAIRGISWGKILFDPNFLKGMAGKTRCQADKR